VKDSDKLFLGIMVAFFIGTFFGGALADFSISRQTCSRAVSYQEWDTVLDSCNGYVREDLCKKALNQQEPVLIYKFCKPDVLEAYKAGVRKKESSHVYKNKESKLGSSFWKLPSSRNL
jgi:hypothetical protein